MLEERIVFICLCYVEFIYKIRFIFLLFVFLLDKINLVFFCFLIERLFFLGSRSDENNLKLIVLVNVLIEYIMFVIRVCGFESLISL